MRLFIVVTIFGLARVGRKKYGTFGRAINFVVEDAILHLKIKKSESNILNNLLADVFGKEFGAEFELQRNLLLDILWKDLFV